MGPSPKVRLLARSCSPSNLNDLTMTDSDSETLPEVGGMSLSMFLDELNPLSKEIHPALPTVLEERRADNAMRGTVTLYPLKLLTHHGTRSGGLISSCCR